MNPASESVREIEIRVLCVDDNADMNAAYQLMIDSDPRMTCVGCCTSADRLLATIDGMSPRPHVILLDATMPGKDPLVAMSELGQKYPEVRTIICSGHDGAAFVQRVKDARAWGFVSKRGEPDVIMSAVREVAAGRAVWPDSSSAR